MSFFNIFRNKSKKNEVSLENVRFVVFDTETTGFKFSTDRILSIGAVTILNNRIDLKNSIEFFLEQEKSNPESIPIHGIIKNHKYQKLAEKEALVQFLEYIEDAILVGHHVGYDVKMINAALQRNELSPLKNKYLDTNYLFKKTKVINYLLKNDKNYSLDEICQELNITTHDRHNAAGDAFLTAIAFLKIINKLKITTLGALLKL
ncbi:3'-5' exonuclease [Capnocytophaga cynodegmi]|uniref:3'-5' exonuclease n=1 Tax=Capnocytophaga cynodegmi TaxID=28189 RepID=UPI001EE30E5D|nr:3'-5' exonuclease [Capnocytophaga cynodegmi]GJQ06396.1 DNA polymerase III subunit epsilon [Capnocytophaga cynodegmi]